jgi:hypothetical protein
VHDCSRKSAGFRRQRMIVPDNHSLSPKTYEALMAESLIKILDPVSE